MSWLLVAPVLGPLVVALVCLAARRRLGLVRGMSVAGGLVQVVSSVLLLARVAGAGPVSTQVAGWSFPVGISLVADLLSAILVLASAILGASVIVYSLGTVGPGREAYGYHALVHVLLGAVAGAFLTGDLFNLYVWFEVILVSSFVLTVLRGGRQQLEGGLTYVGLSLLGSALFLAAAGTLYSMVGSLNLADLSVRLSRIGAAPPVVVSAILLFLAFAIKAAAFPFFRWLPDAYTAPPAAVSALFAGLLTKVGVYALIRISTLLFMPLAREYQPWLLGVAGLTMLTGVLGALAQSDFRRLLAFHSISQVGYMLMGWALLTPLAVAGALFFVVHHLLVKANLFLIAGIVGRGAGTDALERLGGMRSASPALSGMFAVSALSLAGLPPFSGFFAKLSLLEAGIGSGHLIVVGVALAVSFLTLFSMAKLWNEVFWKAAPGGSVSVARSGTSEYLPVVALTVLILLLAIGAEPALALTARAAEQILDSAGYLEAVSTGF